MTIIILLVCLFLYFIPFFVAYSRKHNNSSAIFVCNVFLGWTFIGWVVAAIWASTDNIQKSNIKNT